MKNLLFSEHLVGKETTYILSTIDEEISLSKKEALWFKKKLEKALPEEHHYSFFEYEDERD